VLAEVGLLALTIHFAMAFLRRHRTVTQSSPWEEGQLLARLTVLECIVGLMVRQEMLKSGKGPSDILGFGQTVKSFLIDRTPDGASNAQLSEAADKFFSAIASDIGSQDTQ
jgi:hypothetical protein